MTILRNQPTEDTQCDPETDKPTELYYAIARMEHVTDRLEGLYSRISNEISVAPDSTKGPNEVCLLTLLNEGPRILQNHIDAQHGKISDIEQIIFNR
jgi:hypothetical protein